ncbi:MAG: hypothetical protein HDQ98_12430 [Lachnospiraceae bacterium]|nr:hypothetical protein [Lachnospiraceae bacterium]
MNYQNQGRQMALDALFKLLKAAPIKSSEYSNYGQYQSLDISKLEFDTWLNYVDSILQISYNHLGLGIIMATRLNIEQIASQNEIFYIYRVEQIKNQILNLAHSILQQY